MSTIKHNSIVNITDFCSRNFLKIAGTDDAKWQYIKFDQIFAAVIAGNLPENRFLGFSSRFYHQFFLIFCTKMRISNAQNMFESDY